MGRTEREIAEVLALRAKRARDHVDRLVAKGSVRSCPICHYHGPFSPVRHKPAIWCPSCDSRPRHRLLKLWLEREAEIPQTARVLHFAAEPWVREALDVAEYRTADLNDKFEWQLDITAMDLPDARFDVIIANHVLEHVDDHAALVEIRRVLSPGGCAILSVPLVAGWETTFDDPTITTAEERRFHYTDPTHLRFYGQDFGDRIAAAGLDPSRFTIVGREVQDFALHRGEAIWLGRKPES
ncbi:MAG: class I SAM-dependent methyltransferase [Pseudomonadota bacterium]